MHNLPYFLDLLGTLQLHQIDTCKRHPTSHQKLYILIDPELFLTITVIYCFQIDTRHFVIIRHSGIPRKKMKNSAVFLRLIPRLKREIPRPKS
jgi:hypothetical protein